MDNGLIKIKFVKFAICLVLFLTVLIQKLTGVDWF